MKLIFSEFARMEFTFYPFLCRIIAYIQLWKKRRCHVRIPSITLHCALYNVPHHSQCSETTSDDLVEAISLHISLGNNAESVALLCSTLINLPTDSPVC